MRIATGIVLITAALVCAAPAAAQTTGTSSSRQKPSTPAKPPAPPLPKPVMNIRAFGLLDIEMMSASDTFKAVTGSSTMIGFGGGGEIVNLWKTLFVRGSFATASSDGERVFIDGTDVISTGIPLTVGVQTIEVAGGWRIRLRKTPKYTPYVGGGAQFVSYSEDSDFQLPGEAVKESFTGYVVLGGIDLQLASRFFATIEGQYRMVPDAIGQGGVSQIYEETSLGGFAVRVMFGYSLLKRK